VRFPTDAVGDNLIKNFREKNKAVQKKQQLMTGHKMNVITKNTKVD
jgi:hypothetical protein